MEQSNKQQSILNYLTKNIQSGLGQNFVCIITSGSFLKTDKLDGWSDLDFVVVLRSANMRAKQFLGSLYKEIEVNFKISLGGVIVEESELQGDFKLLDGKVVQTIIEFNAGDRVTLPDKIKLNGLRCLNSKEIKDFSLIDSGKIFAIYRRLISRADYGSKNEIEKVFKKSIHLSIIMTKLAIQYLNNTTVLGDKDMLIVLNRDFPDSISSKFYLIIEFKNKWKDFAGQDAGEIHKKLLIVDDYFESLKKYVFEKN